MEEALKPKGREWNVDFIAAIYTFDLQKTLDLKRIAKNFIEKKTGYEAIFIPWEEKPISLKEEDNKFSDFDFNDIKKYVKDKKLNKKHKLFVAAIGSEKISLEPRYLNAGKFVRIKLPDIEIQFTSEQLNQLGKMNAEVHLLIYKMGIIIATLYIRPPLGKTLNTYQIIEIERRLPDEEVEANGDKNKLEEHLLDKLEELFLKELKNVDISVAVRKLKKRWNYPRVKYAVCIRNYCQGANIVPKEEFYGILNAMRGWYLLRERKIELKELYNRRDFYIFVGNSGSLFFGLDKFEKHIEETNNIFEKETEYSGKLYFLYTFPEYFEHYIITPVEFLSIIDTMLERYFNIIQDLPKSYWKATKFIREFFEDIQEYNNITFMRARPIWKIVKDGGESLGIPEMMDAVKAGISTLASVTQQDTLICINIAFGIVGVLSAGVLVWEIYHNLWITIECMSILFLLFVKVSGIRATFYTLINRILSVGLRGDFRKWIDDAYLILKTKIEVKFKKYNKIVK
jgi:hypothetical protein